jgi:hypothetical protein
MNGDNINYMLLNYSALGIDGIDGIDGMKLALLHYIALHYISYNISDIHINININININIKYLIIHSFHCNELFVLGHAIALSRMS